MSKTTPEETKALMRKHCAAWSHCDMVGLATLIDEVRGVDAEPVAWTPGPNEFKDWCSRWFGPDSDDDYLAKAIFNLPLMAQKFENMPAIGDPVTESSVKLLRGLAKELDEELHSGAKWTKTQHICNSVSGALLDIARKLEVAECENCKQLSRALAEEINGPTFMGEPALPQKPSPAPSQPAAPVKLPVVAWFYECADGTTLARTKDDKPVDDGEPLVKLSDAQAAIAAGRKA